MEDLRAKPFQSLNVLQRETFDIIMRESLNVFLKKMTWFACDAVMAEA